MTLPWAAELEANGREWIAAGSLRIMPHTLEERVSQLARTLCCSLFIRTLKYRMLLTFWPSSLNVSACCDSACESLNTHTIVSRLCSGQFVLARQLVHMSACSAHIRSAALSPAVLTCPCLHKFCFLFAPMHGHHSTTIKYHIHNHRRPP